VTTIEATFSRHTRKPRAAYRTYSKPNYSKCFRNFIEHSDWDVKIIAHEGLANRICVGIIIFSVLYFAPALIKVFLK
jgi:hypothetical protein